VAVVLRRLWAIIPQRPYYCSTTGVRLDGNRLLRAVRSAKEAHGYNPYTGTLREVLSSTPMGSEAQLKVTIRTNRPPSQTEQGIEPNARGGLDSYAARGGNQSAKMGHYSTANGTVAGAADCRGKSGRF